MKSQLDLFQVTGQLSLLLLVQLVGSGKNDSDKSSKESVAEGVARKLDLEMGQLRRVDRYSKKYLPVFRIWGGEIQCRRGQLIRSHLIQWGNFRVRELLSKSCIISAATMETVWEKSVGCGVYLELETAWKEWKWWIITSSFYVQYIETLEMYVTEIESWMTA